MIRFTFASQALRAVQMALPFTFAGLEYESGDWIVLAPERREAFSDRLFWIRFGAAIDQRRSA